MINHTSDPDHRFPVVHQLLDAGAGYAPVTNLIAVGDPDVCQIDGQWWMYVGAAFTDGGGEPTGVSLFSASLPPGEPLAADSWSFTTGPDDPTQAVPLVELPGPGHFDEWLHTPCRVVGTVPGQIGEVERLYYTGTAGEDPDPAKRSMAIGVLERVNGHWRRRDEPIVVGSPDRACVLEPKVVHHDGRWRIWYQATDHEAGPGELPDCEIHYVESEDGITDWTSPRVVFSSADNWFDAAVTPVPGGFHMLAARAPNMFGGVSGLPPQGLWSMTASRPSGERHDWTATPSLLLDADTGASWFAGGIYGPCAVKGTTPEDRDRLHVFFTGSAPPDPDPYVLSIGRFEVALPQV